MRIVTIDHDQESFRFRIPTKKDWEDLAEYLMPLLKPGSIVTLSGPLGAGKTTFVQVLAKRLGVKKNPSSPTFALMRAYAGGQLHYRETISEGLDSAPQAFLDMLDGRKLGKQLVRLR